MKTTLNLPDPVVLKAKRQALEEGTTLTDLIVQGLKARLDKKPALGPLPVSLAQGGLVPGVSWMDLEPADSAADYYR